MQKKKKLKIIMLIIILICILLVTFNFFNNKNNKNNTRNIEKTYKLKYSEAYMQYLNLPEEERNKLGVVPRMYDISLDNLESINEEALKTKVGETPIPAQFSLKNQINIKVENQESYGVCWAFASLNALETNLALKTGTTYDFSESHVDHLMSPIFGNDDRELHGGGMFYYFMEYVMSNYGPILETDVPYENPVSPYGQQDYLEWEAFGPTIDLVQIVDLPTINKKTTTYTPQELTAMRSTIKTHIMENGSLYASIRSTDIKTFNGKKVLNSNASALIQDHAITIIGWDDNFATTNFPTESRPTNPGAYIALNSWGEDWGESGVFYISYEDVYVEQEMSGVVSTTTTFNYVDFQVEDDTFYTALKQELNGKCISSIDNTKSITIKTFTQNYMQYLELVDKGINSIQGIQALQALYYLNLSKNNLSNVTPILQLPNLDMLEISENTLRDLTDVFNSSLQGLSAISQKIIEDSNGTSNEIIIPPIFYQAFYINGGTGVSVSAKIYYNCDRNEVLNDASGINYSNININSSTATAKITLDRQISDTKAAGTRAIKVTLTDTGFVNGSTYTFYYDVLKGDINNNEVIDSMDAYSTLVKVEAGTTLTTDEVKRLDINLDGIVNREDVYLILEKAVQ
ncbi:MAG TPA: C1 family peptidase [Clostridia bacterium]|nr:C1 family peptidase [Clostridia bacterium]